MSYTVLARRYRSTSFDEVVGQEPIARTLINAIATGRVAHAYLFTGTRGVGKTSMARLFARALNAPDTIEGVPHEQGVEYPPTDVQQRMAEAIMRGDDLNVIEIDGASNNSVENARQLIANAGLAPTGNAVHKVYIIDEVHMLSTAAFNALLKTMEEPPSHVKFILCTTEPHKVPETIQSRCQRFDFRNIATKRIADHLSQVIQRENVEADPQVVWELARLANGSMRDGLSLTDRLIASCGDGKLTSESLEQMLGLPPRELVVGLVDALADGDAAAALKRTAELLERGISQDQLVDVLIDRLRTLMLIDACGTDSELVELPDDARPGAAEQAARFDAAGLTYMIALCENLQRHARSSSTPRALLDATIVRLALAENMADVSALLAGRNGGGQKKKLAPGEAPRQAPAAPRPPVAAGPPAGAPRPQPEPTPSPQARPTATPPNDAPTAPADRPTAGGDPWRTLLANIDNKPAMSWVRAFRLTRMDERTAWIDTVPGQRRMRGFFTAGNKRDQLAMLLGEVMGRPVRVELEPESAPGDSAGAAGTSTDGRDQRADDARGGQSPAHPDDNAGRPTLDRRAAMGLPLVKRLMEEFEVSVVDIRPAQERTPPTADDAGDDDENAPD